MNSIHTSVEEEIALEGLDGITLDALWFRLSERLKFPLPLNDHFQDEIWKLVVSRTCYEFFEIAADRPTPKVLDRREYFFNNDISNDELTAHFKSVYYIYDYQPVDDPDVRGSCKEFKTRKKLSQVAVTAMDVKEVQRK